jgi:predicted nucleic acid-binding protein
MVVFDTTILLFLLNKNTPSSVPGAVERVEYLIDQLSDAGGKVIIPTPVLAECLTKAGAAGPDYLALIGRQSVFRVVGYDERAAVETAARLAHVFPRARAADLEAQVSRHRIKLDWQIVAVAAVEGATAVYSDDPDVVKLARDAGMEAFRLADLPLPPEEAQTALPFNPADKP